MDEHKNKKKRIKAALRRRRCDSLRKLRSTSEDESEDDVPAALQFSNSTSIVPCIPVENEKFGEGSEMSMSSTSDSEVSVCENVSKKSCSDPSVELNKGNKGHDNGVSLPIDDISDSSSDQSSSCFSESSEEESSDFDEKIKLPEVTDPALFPDQLRKWALKNKIRHTQLTELLKMLHPFFPNLPRTAKTFLNSSSVSQYQVEKFLPGNEDNKSEFVYFGIEEHLKKSVNPDLHLIDMIIFLMFFIDGLPLFKSSPIQLWPLLGKVFSKSHDVYKPFNIATWCGEGKPESVELYFSRFIAELNHLMQNGIVIQNKKFKVRCKCFICDRPARAFAKQTQGHAGFYACERCHLKAYKEDKITIFPAERGEPRTDETFRRKVHLEHHNAISPLEDIEPHINMIFHFIIESMHAGPIGNMKRLITKMWIGGEKKMSKVNALKLSVRMTNLSHQIPWEFQRKTRSLGSVNYYTANEFDFFLKYAGPFVLDELLENHLFEHFLLLHVPFRILSSPTLHKTHSKIAGSYLDSFVKLAGLPNYYGLLMNTINMHDLLHMPDDVIQMGCDITRYAAFPFENDLGVTKRDIRSGNKPLSQLCQRRAEKDLLIERPTVPPTYCVLKTAKRGGKKVITKLKCKGFEIGSSYPNNIVLLKNGNFMRVSQMFQEHDGCVKNYHVRGSTFIKKCPAFSFPPRAFEVLNMFALDENPAAVQETFPVSDIQSKCLLLQIYELDEREKKMYGIPMLHE